MVLRDLVWGHQGYNGPSGANAVCPALQLFSRRDGDVWTQSYVFGVATGPAERVRPTDGTGTTIRLTTDAPIDGEAVRSLTDGLRSRIDGLDLVVALR